MTAAVPAIDFAALRAYLHALDLEQLRGLACNASTPAAVQPCVGEVLAERLSDSELEAACWRPATPCARLRVDAWPSGVLAALRATLTTRQRAEGVSWDRQRLQRRAAGEPVALIGGRPSTLLWYAGEQVSIRSLERLYRDTEAVLTLLRSDRSTR